MSAYRYSLKSRVDPSVVVFIRERNRLQQHWPVRYDPSNSCATCLCSFSKVALTPYVWKPFEIGSAIARAVVVPERQRHRREGRSANQFTLFSVCGGRSIIAPDVNGQTETGTLNLTPVDRTGGVTGDEARHDIGAAGVVVM